MRTFGVIVGILIAAVLGLALAMNRSNSTQGVTAVGNIARVPQGETLVLTYKTVRIWETWKLTHDGSHVTVTCSGLCGDPKPAALCGVNCEVVIRAGIIAEFKVRLREDGAVDVTLPESGPWTYRPPS